MGTHRHRFCRSFFAAKSSVSQQNRRILRIVLRGNATSKLERPGPRQKRESKKVKSFN